MKKWGIEYVIFALIFGLIISNIFKVPQFLRAAGQTEYFIKIGLVCMGAGILFSDVLRGGFMGLVQAVLVATAVWFMTYWICRKFQVSERFSAIIASANAICGVSATIAAGGAIQGDKKGSQLHGGLGAGVCGGPDPDYAADRQMDGICPTTGPVPGSAGLSTTPGPWWLPAGSSVVMPRTKSPPWSRWHKTF